MAGSRTRPPEGGQSTASEVPDFTQQEAAEYIASLLEGLKSVAHSARMPFLAYLINVALEEAKSEKDG